MTVNDSAYTLHLQPQVPNKGKFRSRNIPWNAGLTWNEMYDEETRERLKEHLRRISHLGSAGKGHPHPKPVIQMDEDGNRLHWYASSVAAAKKLGLQDRNIRSVCEGKRPRCGGFRWKFDERFI